MRPGRSARGALPVDPSDQAEAPAGVFPGASAVLLIAGLGLYFLLPGPGVLLGATLASIGAALAPPVGLLAALATLPLHLETRPIGPLAVSSSELLLLAAAVGTVALLGQAERSRFNILATPFDRPILLFLSSAALSLLVTEYLRLSLRELRTLILEPVLAYFLIVGWFSGRAVVRPLAAFLAGAVGVALAGLVGLPFGWGLTEAEGVRRLQATYPSPNHLGLLLGRALPWLLAAVWLGGRWRWPALAAMLIVLGALFATFSLGAWLGSGAAALCVLGLLGGRRLVAACAAALAALAALGLAVFRVERLSSHLEPGRGTTFFRLQLWQSALAMVRDHPVFGVGLDNFLYLYQQRYIRPGALAEANLSHPHNLVLHFWLELGLAGLVAAAWLLLEATGLIRRLLAAQPDRPARALAVGAAGSLVDFVVHGSIDNSYFLPDMALVFWLTLAVLAALSLSPLPPRPSPAKQDRG